jgi:hypothetical protein
VRDTEVPREEHALRPFARAWRAEQHELHDSLSRRSYRCNVCPVQCIYESDAKNNVLFAEVQAGNGEIENRHTPKPDAIAIFGRQHPVREQRRVHVMHRVLSARRARRRDLLRRDGAERRPDGELQRRNPNKSHDHTFFIQLSAAVFADEIEPRSASRRPHFVAGRGERVVCALVHDLVADANRRATGRGARCGFAHHRDVVVLDLDEHGGAARVADEFASGH